MADHFLTKSAVTPGQILPLGAGAALDRHGALQALLTARVSPEAAALFAEPLVSRGNDAAPGTIARYVDRAGDGRPLDDLDAAAQARAGAILAREMGAIAEQLAAPDLGPEDALLLGAALHLGAPARASLWVVGDRPVILNWGMLPPEVPARDRTARTRQMQAVLGRVLPLARAPAITPAERQEDRSGAAGPADGPTGAPPAHAATGAPPAGGGGAAAPAPRPAAGAASAGAAGVAGGVAGRLAAGGAGGSGGPGMAASAVPGGDPAGVSGGVPGGPGSAGAAAPPEDPRRIGAWAWAPLLALLLLATAVLVWLLIPGTRIFAERGSLPDPAEAERIATGINASLEERRRALEAALGGAQCRADGTLVMPGGLTIEGMAPPVPGNPLDAPGQRAPADPRPILPPDPDRVRAPGGTGSLLDHIESRTAMVIVPRADGGLTTGSGFFVAPDLVLTSAHVLEARGAAPLHVTGAALGARRAAEVVTTQGPFATTGRDFALLRVPGAASRFFAIFDGGAAATGALRLQSVIAAGYPGDLLQSDGAFPALSAGDIGAVPGMAVTDGTVTAEQALVAGARAVVHSAPISQGSSGGPLVDMCGRVVGMNTFVRQGELRTLNFALSSADVIAFLGAAGITPTAVSAPCQPEILRPSIAGAVPAPVPPASASVPTAPMPGLPTFPTAPLAAPPAAAPPSGN